MSFAGSNRVQSPLNMILPIRSWVEVKELEKPASSFAPSQLLCVYDVWRGTPINSELHRSSGFERIVSLRSAVTNCRKRQP